MASVTLAKFQGLRPRVSSRLLGENQAQVAIDCNLLGGDLRSAYKDLYVQDATVNGAQSLYYWNKFDTWLTWDSDVDVVRGSVARDLYNRIYVTGDGVPKVMGGSTGSETYDLGVPQPTSKPKIATNPRTDGKWSLTWFYFYEESDGTRQDEGELDDEFVSVSKFGEEYTFTEPTRVNGSTEAQFIPYAKAYDENDNFLGRVIPSPSVSASSLDLTLNGQLVTADYVDSTAKMTLEYQVADTDDAFGAGTAYVYTFVTAWGEEGPPSTPSDSLTVKPSEAAVVSNIQSTVPGTHNIDRVRLYRLAIGDSSGGYKYVTEFSLGVSKYTDTTLDSGLAETLESDNYFPPPADLAGIVMHPKGFVAGFSDRTVYCSETNLPHAFPLGTQYAVDYDIVGLGVAGNSIIVMTTGHTYALTGVLPNQLDTFRVSGLYPCVNKRSIADNGITVLYAAADGLVAVSDHVGRLMTKELYRETQWRDLGPFSMVAEVYDGIYHAWSTSGAIAIDFDEGGSALTTLSSEVDGVWRDLETDSLYFLEDDKIYQYWGDTDNRKEATWRSREFTTGRPVHFGVGRVVATEYPVTFRLYKADTKVAEVTVDSDEAFRLPSVGRDNYHAVELAFSGDVDRVNLGQSMREVE